MYFMENNPDFARVGHFDPIISLCSINVPKFSALSLYHLLNPSVAHGPGQQGPLDDLVHDGAVPLQPRDHLGESSWIVCDGHWQKVPLHPGHPLAVLYSRDCTRTFYDPAQA